MGMTFITVGRPRMCLMMSTYIGFRPRISRVILYDLRGWGESSSTTSSASAGALALAHSLYHPGLGLGSRWVLAAATRSGSPDGARRTWFHRVMFSYISKLLKPEANQRALAPTNRRLCCFDMGSARFPVRPVWTSRLHVTANIRLRLCC
jgi:hypothetical protein